MNVVELFLKYLPVLMVLTPLVGVLNVVVVFLVDRNSLDRTFFPNLCLTTVLLIVLVFAFEFGPQRSGLFLMESFQFHSQISLPIVRTDKALSSLSSFGVDGLSLPIIAMVVVFPLLTFFREGSNSCVVLSLCLQSSLLAVVTTLDWRIACGALFSAALLLRLILARTLSVRAVHQTSRWLRRTFLGDVMLAGGTLYLFLVASNILQMRGDNYSEVIYQLRDYFTRIEYFQEFDAERVVELTLKSSPAISLLLMGVLLRLPVRIDPSDSIGSQRVAGMWMWLYGPVVAVSFATRAFQSNPEFAYAFLAPIRTILISLIFVLGLVSSVSQVDRGGRVRLMQVLMILLVVGLCTPNPTSFAGMYLLLLFLPSLGARTDNANETSSSVSLTVLPMALGSLLILLGLFQGSGTGDRGLMQVLVAGSGLTLCVFSIARFRSRRISLISQAPKPLLIQSEFPIWELDDIDSPNNELVKKPRPAWSLARVVLCLCLLILPQQAWQRIRWDVQRIDFPTTSADSHLSVLESSSKDRFKNAKSVSIATRNVSEGEPYNRSLNSPSLTLRVSLSFETSSLKVEEARDAGEGIR